MDLYEQMDIFELLDTCFRTSMQTALPVMEDKAEDMQEEMSSYLRREEKILSIARERMKRMESGWMVYAGTVGTFYNPDTRESFQKII